MHAVKDIFKVENSGRVSVLMLVRSLRHHGICCHKFIFTSVLTSNDSQD